LPSFWTAQHDTLHPNITIILLSFLFPSVSPQEYAWLFLVASCFSLGQLWRSVLARWSTTTFCVSCSRMAWQPFSWSMYGVSRTSRMTSLWYFFVRLVQRGSLPIETETDDEEQIRILLPLFLYTSSGRVSSLCLRVCRSVCKSLEPALKSNTQ